MEELPADFWDAPSVADAGGGRFTASSEARPVERPEPSPSRGSKPTPPPAADDDRAAPTDLEQAFEQLQSLFPGRVVEVRPPEMEETAPDPVDEQPHDELPDVDGYDVDDQDQLSFGPGGS